MKFVNILKNKLCFIFGKEDETRERNSPDILLLISAIALLIIGLIMFKSASAYYSLKHYGSEAELFAKQIIFALIGIAGMIIASLIDYKIIKKCALPIIIASSLLLIAVLIPHIGHKVNGARRWILIGGFRFQPSEISKLAIIIFLAKYYSTIKEKASKFLYGILIPGLIIGFTAGLIIIEPHISCAIIISLVGIFIVFTSGADKKTLGIIFGVLAILIVGFVLFTDYASERINVWLHPESDIYGKGWQAYQSLIAIGAGGVFGKGYGNSVQKTSWLPEAHNDFILSIICEEIGLVGALAIILLFVLLIVRGYKIASKAPDNFSKLLAFGISIKIAIQVIFNIAVVTGSVPTTGVSLPFFSYGGTALIMQMIEIGILISISRFKEKN